MGGVILTVGHSNHTVDHFFDLLSKYEIAFLIDVRSHPYSKFAPQFNSDNLRIQSKLRKIRYAYFGNKLGGRPKNKDHYDESGRALYYKMSKSEDYIGEVERLVSGAETYLIAIMCSEENPVFCHRRLLLSRSLVNYKIEVFHIRGNGYLQPEDELSAKRPLIPTQRSFFDSEEDKEWKSFQSVLHRPQQKTSSKESDQTVSDVY